LNDVKISKNGISVYKVHTNVCAKIHHNKGFQSKRLSFLQKLAKIAENSDHDVRFQEKRRFLANSWRTLTPVFC
jgi:hypothetical protein